MWELLSWTRLDQYGRRHPGRMFWATIGLAIVTTLILIYNTKDQVIVYRAF
jgi:hypothetical protein